MIEVLKSLLILAGIIMAFMFILVLITTALVIVVAIISVIREAINEAYDKYKKNKQARHYIKDAKKIIEREKNEI